MAYNNLTNEQVAEVAARYNLEPTDKLVLDNAAQADENHGKLCQNTATGQVFVNWGTDEFGYYQAVKLLDGYLCEETRVMRCDELAYRQFERDAY